MRAVGPPSQGSFSGGSEGDLNECDEAAGVRFFTSSFRSVKALPADFLGEGAAFSHGSGR